MRWRASGQSTERVQIRLSSEKPIRIKGPRVQYHCENCTVGRSLQRLYDAERNPENGGAYDTCCRNEPPTRRQYSAERPAMAAVGDHRYDVEHRLIDAMHGHARLGCGDELIEF